MNCTYCCFHKCEYGQLFGCNCLRRRKCLLLDGRQKNVSEEATAREEAAALSRSCSAAGPLEEEKAGSTCWQLEQRFAHMLCAVGGAGGQVEVVVCGAAVQVLG